MTGRLSRRVSARVDGGDPLWGKLGGRFGRKRLYLASTSIFLIA
ncbi:hypothetical protein [Streptomyces spinoverrucosus]|nr:hypothetical protein [Streptomyces spinoverrucosus]